MNKKGFTLQETLVTLGIIGIVAAITVPGLAKMMPNRDQQLVVKAYQTLTDLTNQMLVDPALYWSDGNCDGLNCTNLPEPGTIPNDLYQDLLRLNNTGQLNMTNKYANILASYLHRIDSRDANNTAFTAADGVVWVISQLGNNIQVSLDTDGVLPNGNLVFANGGNIPDDPNFAFIVSQDGRVDAGDRLTRAFLDDPTAKKKKNQYLDIANDEDIVIKNRASDNVSVSGFCSENHNGQFVCHAQDGNEIFGNNTAPLTISLNRYPVLNSAAGITFPY